MRKFVTVSIFLSWLALGLPARCQCTGSSPTWKSTPDESSVRTCVSKASAGDTINVTAGSGTVTWTTQLAITKPVKIIGPGASSLTILDNAGSRGELILWSGSYGATACASPSTVCFRFSGFTVAPVSSSTPLFSPIGLAGTCSAAGCPNIRIDNISFTGWSEAGNGTAADWLIRTDNVFGVVDHNIASDAWGFLANVNHSSYLGVGHYGDNSWAAPDSFGTANALYFEDNKLDNNQTSLNDCDIAPTKGSVGGCRLVVRHNTFNGVGFSALYNHGTDSNQRPRGGKQAELYQNKITCLNTSQGCQGAAALRSGLLLQWGNTVTTGPGSWFNSLIVLNVYRTFFDFPPYGKCDGSSAYDQNDGVVYASGTYTGSSGSQNFVDSTKSWGTNQWAGSAVMNGMPYSIRNVTQDFGEEIASNTSNSITPFVQAICNWGSQTNCKWNNGDKYQILRASVCMDQEARSGGTLLSGSKPTARWVNEALVPIYEWLDETSGASVFHGTVGKDTNRLIANRDYYTYQTSGCFGTQSTGVCAGALSKRASNCTTGVAFWATDQGNWNQSGSGGQGVLYVCASTNTWTLYYVPYTYPHPLITGAPQKKL